MLASELVIKIQEHIAEHGDTQVIITEHGHGGRSVSLISNRISSEEIGGYLLGENGYDDDVTRELFPEWDGEEETIEELGPVTCLNLSAGRNIYST